MECEPEMFLLPVSNMKVFTIIVLFGFVLLQATVAELKEFPELPSFVPTCRRSEPELSKCVMNSLTSLKDRLASGIPELFIPPLEPLMIPELQLKQDSGAIYLHSTYKNIKIKGLSSFSVKNLTLDKDNLRFNMTLLFPLLKLDAHYKMKGKIIMMPLMGEGSCKANITNVELSTVICGEKIQRLDETFIKIKKVKVDYKINDAQLHFSNLFKGDNVMGERLNSFLNENWSSLSEEIAPVIKNTLSKIIESSTDKVFKTYRIDDIFPK